MNVYLLTSTPETLTELLQHAPKPDSGFDISYYSVHKQLDDLGITDFAQIDSQKREQLASSILGAAVGADLIICYKAECAPDFPALIGISAAVKPLDVVFVDRIPFVIMEQSHVKCITREDFGNFVLECAAKLRSGQTDKRPADSVPGDASTPDGSDHDLGVSDAG